jgi:serine/threonine protein kinase
VVRSLGSGGMGVVMLARDPEGRAATDNHSASGLVAIKIPRPELAGNARAIERFLTEANHMRQFGHPHILQVLEIGDSSTQPFIVMPHLRRGNLAEYLAKHSPLPEHEVLRLARELASALLHAHHHGIIHRDLKPANVLLNDRNQAVLTDFGLARTVFNEGIDRYPDRALRRHRSLHVARRRPSVKPRTPVAISMPLGLSSTKCCRSPPLHRPLPGTYHRSDLAAPPSTHPITQAFRPCPSQPHRRMGHGT